MIDRGISKTCSNEQLTSRKSSTIVVSRLEYTTTMTSSSEYRMFSIVDPNVSVSPDYIYISYMCQSLYFLTNLWE